MTTTILERETQETNGDLLDFGHLVCECNEDLSLCGLDLSDRPPADPTVHHCECVVCEDLATEPCPRCGE